MEPVVLQLQTVRNTLQQALNADADFVKPSLPWRPGDRVSATVESVRTDGRMWLRIGDMLFDAPRYATVDIGQRLNLRFVSATPRPTFVVDDQPEGVHATSVAISASARRLDAAILALAAERSEAAEGVAESAPLLPTPEAARLAAALQKAVESSGLFYEAHLAKWVKGQWPIERIRQEPQDRLAHSSAESESKNTQNAPADTALVQAAAVDDNALSEELALASSVAPSLHVRDQLEVLDTHQLLWQGRLWPGQLAEWRIDERLSGNDELDEPRSWTSCLRLTLPTLGAVSAKLVLTGPSLRLALAAQEEGTRAALASGQRGLRAALSDAAIALDEFKVTDDSQ